MLVNGSSLKGQCHEIFECWFLRQIVSPGPISGTLGKFGIFPNDCRDIQRKVKTAVYHAPPNGDLERNFSPPSGNNNIF